jgi:hypothetical protein
MFRAHGARYCRVYVQTLRSPFDFTARGGYAQGERRKKSNMKAPVVLSVP